MTKEEIIRNLKYTMEKHRNDTVNTFGTNISVMCKDILDYLEQELKTTDDSQTETVSLAVFEQVKWERDIAIQQLEEFGYGLGAKIRTDDDCVSREAVINVLTKNRVHFCDMVKIISELKDLPPVTPEERTGR